MQGKIHPYWYISSNVFPCVYSIKVYQSDWGWYERFETNNSNVIIPHSYYNMNSNASIPIRFNSKVSQFEITEKVYTTDDANTQKFAYQRTNEIKCYYPDDFTVEQTLSPSSGSLTLDDLDDLCSYTGTDSNPSMIDNVFNENNKLYIGRKYKHQNAWKLEINPHTLAGFKGITNYDFALIKYINWGRGGDKAIISNKNYYPMGWFERDTEYWTLLHKLDNERLYIVRNDLHNYHGIGIYEIQYLKQ